MTTPATNRQVPDNSILDRFNKQNYLGNRYGFVLPVTASGTTEVAELLLKNPAVSGTSFPNQAALFVDLRRVIGTVTSANALVNVYLNPTVTSAGTTKTPTNFRVASSNVSGATLTSGPTISVNGTLIESLAVPGFGTANSEACLILDPGQSLLVTLTTANAAVVNLQLSWFEL